MGLDAFVPCNCFEEGLISRPPEPFRMDDLYRDEEGHSLLAASIEIASPFTGAEMRFFIIMSAVCRIGLATDWVMAVLSFK